jgi:hypothetical protein
MKFKEIVSVSGISGLKRIIGQRVDGLILADLDDTNRRFFSNRINMFSPLENISIYTEDDSVPLLDVFIEMKNQIETNPPVDPTSDSATLRSYLEKILPNFDHEKVQISDIKKLIKWYHLLEPLAVLVKEEVNEPETQNETKVEADTVEKSEEVKPTKKKGKSE